MALPVYVVHFQAPEWCRDTVRSLQQSDCSVDITVVNNGGELGDLPVRVVDMPSNVGYTGAANWAIADCPNEPWLVLTSHDLVVERETLSALVTAGNQHPDAGILGADVGWRGDELLGGGPGIEWRDWTSGSCLLLRRRCLDEIGGFDERLHSYGDDVDLAFRARAAGWRVGRVLDARARDRGSAVGIAQRERLIMANRVLLAYKHEGWGGVASTLTLGLLRQMGYQLKLGLRSRERGATILRIVVNEATGAASGVRRLLHLRRDLRER